MTDLCHLPAHELVRLMATGVVSCREVLDAHLTRIDSVNPGLNALIAAADTDALRRSAEEADHLSAQGEPLGRAHGLPVVVKDVMLVSGLRAEGAIVLGMTNVPEMGRGGETNNNLYGRTNNPFDHTRTPGGSSGGSAALVSAGGAALSVGSDGGGSIRQPSHNCGIAGLKPTHGRIPRTGSVFGDAPGIFSPFNCYGPLARSVADLQLALSIMSGPDLGDPYAAAAAVDNPDDVDVASLRVAAYLIDGISPPEAQVAAVVTAAAQAVADAGAAVRWDQPECLGRTIELLWESVFLGGDRGQGFEADLAAMGATDPSEEFAEFLRQARDVEFTVTEARNRLVDIDTFRLDMLAFMADYDVIIGPAMPGPAKPHHHGLVEISDFSHLMAHNLTGWPAVVVRCGTSSEGLPIGVQIAARPWQDATALAVAAHLEATLGGWQPPP